MRTNRDIITSYKTTKYRSYFSGDMQYKVQFFDKNGNHAMMFIYHYEKEYKCFVWDAYTTKTHKAMMNILCETLSEVMGYTIEMEVK